MKNGKLTAVIPARSGSQRVKNKNTKKFSNTTLIELKIKCLKNVVGLDEIIISTDSEEIFEIASENNIKIHKREKYFASNEVNNSDFMENLATSIDSEHIMYAPCTSPLISSETISNCVKNYMTTNITSLATATSQKHHMWLDGKPLNYDPSNSPNSQDLPDIVSVNYGCCIISKKDMISQRNILTDNPFFYITDEIESIDIDTEFDFLVAEIIFNKITSEV